MTLTQDDEAKMLFLNSVKNGLKKWPDLLPEVLTAVNAGFATVACNTIKCVLILANGKTISQNW